MQTMTSGQRKIFWGCAVVYAGAYLGRLNLSPALPALISAYSLTEAQAGLIQTVFAIIYAVGQFANGAIVDRVSARRYIATGLALSALCNALLGFSSAYWQVLLLWALNGAAQSMLWTPVVKLLAGWFDDQGRRRACFWVAIASIGGHFLAWAIGGYMSALFSWRWSFWIPSLLLLGLMALALLWLRDPDHAVLAHGSEKVHSPSISFSSMVFGTGLWLVLIGCIASGFARDGVMTWGPSILDSLAPSGSLSSTTLSLIIPVVNLFGVLLGQFMLKRSAGKTRQSAALLMGAGALVSASLLLRPSAGLFSYALLLGLCCALMNGVNPLLTMVLPMDYARFGRVAMVAGLIDSFVYLGSALAGVTGGLLQDALGQWAVFASWSVLLVLGTVALLFSSKVGQKSAALS